MFVNLFEFLNLHFAEFKLSLVKIIHSTDKCLLVCLQYAIKFTYKLQYIITYNKFTNRQQSLHSDSDTHERLPVSSYPLPTRTQVNLYDLGTS